MESELDKALRIACSMLPSAVAQELALSVRAEQDGHFAATEQGWATQRRLAAERDAATARAEEAERTLAEARAVALGGDGMTHEQALAAVIGLVADLREAREVLREVEWEGDVYRAEHDSQVCPSCGYANPSHGSDCRLARALSATGKEGTPLADSPASADPGGRP